MEGGGTSENRRTCTFAYLFSMWLREPLLNSTPLWGRPNHSRRGEGHKGSEGGGERRGGPILETGGTI